MYVSLSFFLSLCLSLSLSLSIYLSLSLSFFFLSVLLSLSLFFLLTSEYLLFPFSFVGEEVSFVSEGEDRCSERYECPWSETVSSSYQLVYSTNRMKFKVGKQYEDLTEVKQM